MDLHNFTVLRDSIRIHYPFTTQYIDSLLEGEEGLEEEDLEKAMVMDMIVGITAHVLRSVGLEKLDRLDL